MCVLSREHWSSVWPLSSLRTVWTWLVKGTTSINLNTKPFKQYIFWTQASLSRVRSHVWVTQHVIKPSYVSSKKRTFHHLETFNFRKRRSIRHVIRKWLIFNTHEGYRPNLGWPGSELDFKCRLGTVRFGFGSSRIPTWPAGPNYLFSVTQTLLKSDSTWKQISNYALQGVGFYSFLFSSRPE